MEGWVQESMTEDGSERAVKGMKEDRVCESLLEEDCEVEGLSLEGWHKLLKQVAVGMLSQ